MRLTPEAIEIPADEFLASWEENKRRLEAGIDAFVGVRVTHTWIEDRPPPRRLRWAFRAWLRLGEWLGFIRAEVGR